MTFGHGIVIKNGSHGRGLIAHELAHVMQYERFGGIDTFLKEYIKEVSFPPRYPHGPLEREAAQIADRICRSP
jgi:predicted SprT family Zn-dependent metalloprotease